MANPNPSPSTRFKKGKSGNPSGRPSSDKELARKIREATNNGLDLVELLLCEAQDVDNKSADRQAAARELLNRGWGKSREIVTLDGEGEEARTVWIVRERSGNG